MSGSTGIALTDRLPCQACGTWTCSHCGWKRHGASLIRPELQDCSRCKGRSGSTVPTRHYTSRIWQDHNPAIGPRCEGWGDYRVAGLPCTHRSCREVTWGNAWEEWS